MKVAAQRPAARPQGATLEASRRVLDRLRRRIQESDFTQRALERRLGFSKGYLSQVFHGNVDLKFDHLLSLLAALEVRAGAFFAEVEGKPQPTVTAAAGPEPPPGTNRYLVYRAAREDLEQRLERCEEVLSAARSRGLLD